MAEKTDRQKLQARAKELGIAANQSSEELEKQIAKAERKAERDQQKANAKSEAQGSSDETRNEPTPEPIPAAASKGPVPAEDMQESRERASEEDTLPPADEHGGVDPEWHNDPKRILGAEELERLKDWEGRGEVKVSTFTPLSHNEMTIDFSGLRPDTDFEVRISGPTAAPYWVTLKSDPWGQAQLIWRTAAGGDYKISAKGPGINVKGEFSVQAYDADAEYRAQKRAARAKAAGHPKGKRAKATTEAVTGSVASVEEPGVMGDTPSGEAKAQPTEEELNDPEKTDPAFTPAESREADADEGKDTVSAQPDDDDEDDTSESKDETEAPAATEKE